MRSVRVPAFSRGPRILARGLIGLLIALGLMLMHGGVGQAQACIGAASGVPTPTSPTLTSEHRHDNTPVDAEDPADKPTKPPASAHSSDLCSSTSVTSSGAGPDAAPALAVDFLAALPCIVLRPGAVSDVTGRHPPPPDLITELCVNRR